MPFNVLKQHTPDGNKRFLGTGDKVSDHFDPAVGDSGAYVLNDERTQDDLLRIDSGHTGTPAVAAGHGATAVAGGVALGPGATASAQDAVAVGRNTTASQSGVFSPGDRDVSLADSRGLFYPDGSANQTLVDKAADGTQAQGQQVGYQFAVNNTAILEVFAESDGGGGIQNADVRAFRSVNLNSNDLVNGSTVVYDASAGYIPQSRLENATITLNGTDVSLGGSISIAVGTLDLVDDEEGVLGTNNDMSIRYDSTADSYAWQDNTNGADRAELDRTSGDMTIEGTLTEGANL